MNILKKDLSFVRKVYGKKTSETKEKTHLSKVNYYMLVFIYTCLKCGTKLENDKDNGGSYKTTGMKCHCDLITPTLKTKTKIKYLEKKK